MESLTHHTSDIFASAVFLVVTNNFNSHRSCRDILILLVKATAFLEINELIASKRWALFDKLLALPNLF